MLALNTVYICFHFLLNLPLLTFSLPFPDDTLTEENQPDMADRQIPSCPGANNTVWSINNSHQYVIYCDSHIDGPELTRNYTLSDCVSACENYTSNPAVGNGGTCVAFSWQSPSSGLAQCSNILRIDYPRLFVAPDVTSFRWTDYELVADPLGPASGLASAGPTAGAAKSSIITSSSRSVPGISNVPGSMVISTSAELASSVTMGGPSSLDLPISAVASTSSSSEYIIESGSTTMKAPSSFTRSAPAVAATSSSMDATPPTSLSGSSMLGIGAGVGVAGIVLIIGLFVFIRRRKTNNIKVPAELSGEHSTHNTTISQELYHRKSSHLESHNFLARLFRLICCGRRLDKDKFRVELSGEFRNGRQEVNGYIPPELHGEKSIVELQAARSIAELEGDRQSRMERKRVGSPEFEKS